MVENHILQKLPRKFRDVSAFLGDLNYMGASYHAAEVAVYPSMAQLRSCLTEYAVLPLVYLHKRSVIGCRRVTVVWYAALPLYVRYLSYSYSSSKMT